MSGKKTIHGKFVGCHVVEKGGMAYDYYVGGIPCLIILDRDGRIVSKNHPRGGNDTSDPREL